MKIKYKFADRTISEVEVNDEIGEVIIESRRKEMNLGRKERYHCLSLDAFDFMGTELASGKNVESEVINRITLSQVKTAIAALPEVQKRRLLMFIDGKTLTEISRIENVSCVSVWNSIERAKNHIKKFFQKN